MKTFLLIAGLVLAQHGDADLAGKTVEALLACSGDASRCSASDWDLAHELERRTDTAGLVRVYERATESQRRVVVFALYLAKREPKAQTIMRGLARSDDDEVAYYALNYLAKSCDQRALRDLSSPPFRVRAACEQWATTVRLFGTCRYSGSGLFLVDSLNHACGNVVQAADASLRDLYPDAPPVFRSIPDEQAYFRERVRGRK